MDRRVKPDDDGGRLAAVLFAHASLIRKRLRGRGQTARLALRSLIR